MAPFQRGLYGFRGALARLLALAGATAFLAGGAQAAQDKVQITAEVDRGSVSVGEMFRFILTVKNDPNAVVEPFTLENARISGPVISTQNTFVFAGNERKSATETKHLYEITPQKEGDLVLGPIRIVSSGDAYTTAPVTVKVLKPREVSSETVRLHIVFDKESYFVNEQITLTVLLESSKPVLAQRAALEIPWLDGQAHLVPFSKTPPVDGPAVAFAVNGQQVQAAQGTQLVGGERYFVYSLKRIYFATLAGEMQLAPVSFGGEIATQTRIDLYGGHIPVETLRVAAVSEKAALKVEELPAADRPDEFNGAVGSFTMSVEAKPTELQLGDPITLTVTIDGTGSIEQLAPPAIDKRNFKGYEPEVRTEARLKGDRVQGQLLCTQILTPQTAELMAIPGIAFAYFDPAQKRYVRLRQEPIPISVGAARVAAASRPQDERKAGESEVRVLTPRILPDKRKIHLELQQSAGTVLTQVGLLTVFAALTLLVSSLYAARRERLHNDETYRSRVNAGRMLRRSLKNVERRPPADWPLKLAQAVSGYLANRTGNPRLHIDSEKMGEFLAAQGVPEELRLALTGHVERLEYLAFSGAKASDEHPKAVSEARKLLRKIRRYL